MSGGTDLAPIEAPVLNEAPLVLMELATAEKPEPDPAFFDTRRCVYFDETGRITSWARMGLAFIRMAQIQGERIVEGEGYDETHFVDTSGDHPAVVEKSPCPAMLYGRTLVNLPVPCAIEIATSDDDATRYDWSAAAADLTFEHPGTYRVRVFSVRHLAGEFTVTANG